MTCSKFDPPSPKKRKKKKKRVGVIINQFLPLPFNINQFLFSLYGMDGDFICIQYAFKNKDKRIVSLTLWPLAVQGSNSSKLFIIQSVVRKQTMLSVDIVVHLLLIP